MNERLATLHWWQEHQDKTFFTALLDHMTSGDSMALVLGRQDGVQHWRNLIGPTKVSEARRTASRSLRAKFGDPANDMRNAVHGSDSAGSAEREIELLFPSLAGEAEGISFRAGLGRSVERVSEEQRRYLERYVVGVLQQGLTAMYRARPQQPLTWLAAWLRKNNPGTAKPDSGETTS